MLAVTSRRMWDWTRSIVVVLSLVMLAEARAAELHVGGAMVSITPDKPVALSGQMNTRISRKVESPVTATVLALESRDGKKSLEQAVMVSCDLVAIENPVLEQVRRRVKERLPDLDPSKLFLSATHTHTAPVTRDGVYEIPKDGVMQPSEYVDFLCERVAGAVVQAWEARKPGRAGWGLGHAIVAQNRRSLYADGRSQMYGPTDKPDFRGIEGPEDQGVEVLCFWDLAGKLLATAINVACPAQEVESGAAVNADFWHEVRESLRSKYGKDLFVLGWTGAGGDQSPHLMYRKAAEERMRNLRGVTRLQELAKRIVAAWEEAYEGARKEMHDDVPLMHKSATLDLPLRTITETEAAAARAKIAELKGGLGTQPRIVWHQTVIDRYEQQKAGKSEPFRMELHVIRIGDTAIATNVFELYTQYGIQIKARSRALQTFLIQLAGPGTYLATQPAVHGGGYSAIAESCFVGPEGGQILVDCSVELINSLWPAP